MTCDLTPSFQITEAHDLLESQEFATSLQAKSIFVDCLPFLIEILEILELFLKINDQWGEKWKTTSIDLTLKLFRTLRAKPVWDIKCLSLSAAETTFSSSEAKVRQNSRRIEFRARLSRQNGVDGWKLTGPQSGEYIRRHFSGYFRCGLVGPKFLWAEV